MNLLKQFDRIIGVLERIWVLVAAAMMFTIMISSTVDVGMRYVFNSPLGALYDLISLYLMPGLFFFALSDTLRANEHVCVDLLHSAMTPRQRHAALVVGYALVTVIFAFMTWAAFSRMLESFRNDDVVAGSVAWPTWVASLFVTLGFALIWMRVVHRFLGHALSALTGRSLIPLPPISGTQEAV
ncbi:MAG TPA: TRAP transporter small permease [Burkholderiales bacterium]|nr:TRAP transporter small permease [Burkholderiales bacterium]